MKVRGKRYGEICPGGGGGAGLARDLDQGGGFVWDRGWRLGTVGGKGVGIFNMDKEEFN
jgi:hypothetical protein